MERTVYTLVRLNGYGEEIDRGTKEFKTEEAARDYLLNPMYFSSLAGWVVRKEVRRTVTVGDTWSSRR